MKKLTVFICLTFLIGIAQIENLYSQEKVVDKKNFEMVLKSDVQWEHLNPARGDKSPSAGTLWGDRKEKVATGFLLRPTDGFSSPPHIHNVSYRAIVISGLIHNDDPDAANMWMPAGSFWTQPKGEVHITAAKGTKTLAYVEIDEGPYLVMPPEKEFDSGERPLNVDHSNIVWIDASDLNWMKSKSEDVSEVAYLWDSEDSSLRGRLIKFPVGFKGQILSKGSEFRAIVIQGELQYSVQGASDTKKLEEGSYFGSKGEYSHQISSKKAETVLYIRSSGDFEVIEK